MHAGTGFALYIKTQSSARVPIMIRYLCLVALTVLAPFAASAEPTLKIINFTAEWCPNCRILDPEMRAALRDFSADDVALVELDLTNAGRYATPDEKSTTFANAISLADSHQAGYLWDWYGGVTGLGVIISADNGEPLSCFNRLLDADAIAARLREADIISRRRQPGTRMPDGPDCPPPLR